MMHISASTAPIRVKQKPLHSQLNAECDKHCYNNLFKYLENPPESLLIGPHGLAALQVTLNFMDWLIDCSLDLVSDNIDEVSETVTKKQEPGKQGFYLDTCEAIKRDMN